MRRLMVFAALALLLAVPASAQKPGPQDGRLRVEIVEAGLFRVRRVEERERRNGIGQFTVEAELERATTTIPGRIGVNFGVRFRVTGQPAGATVPVTVLTLFPPPGLPVPGRTPPVQRSSTEMTMTVGEGRPSYRGFGFDEAWEIVPGIWRFEFRIGDEVVATQAFTVVKAD